MNTVDNLCQHWGNIVNITWRSDCSGDGFKHWFLIFCLMHITFTLAVEGCFRLPRDDEHA